MRRLAALTTTSILALTLAPAAPTSAAPTPDSHGGTTSSIANDYRAIVPDPTGDALDRRNGKVYRDSWRARLADTQRASFVTPTTDDGVIRVRVNWTKLRGPRTKRAQLLSIFINDAPTGRSFNLYTTSQGFQQIVELNTDPDVIISPEILEVDLTPGAGGEMDIRFSTEWLTGPGVRLASTGSFERAVDTTSRAVDLRFGE